MPRLLSALEPEVVVSASLVEGSVEGVSKRMGMGRGNEPPSWPPDLKCGSDRFDSFVPNGLEASCSFRY